MTPTGRARFGARPADWHFQWSSRLPPIARIRPGSRLHLDIPDASSGQLGPDSTRASLRRLDLDRVDAAVGPVEVVGAQPGDGILVQIESLRVASWGWSGVFKEFGLLTGRFADDLVIWSIDGKRARPRRGFLRPVEIPLQPMLGWIGVAPAARGDHPMIPPRRTGGNMDSRLHAVGSSLLLPVEVPGALLSLGDPHAAMGDGEVCGTGIETPARATVRVDLVPGGAPPFPRVEVARPPQDAGAVWVATGIASDPLAATRAAVENLLAMLTERGLSEKEAYLLASLVGHLRLSEVVDLPNYVVSMTFPRSLVGVPTPRPASFNRPGSRRRGPPPHDRLR